MDDKLVRYTLRVDRLLFKKFRYIAESEGRSANKEIEQYLKKRVAEFEKENGKIELQDKKAKRHEVIFYLVAFFNFTQILNLLFHFCSCFFNSFNKELTGFGN